MEFVKELIEKLNNHNLFFREISILSTPETYKDVEVIFKYSDSFENTIRSMPFIDMNNNIEIIEEQINFLLNIKQSDIFSPKEQIHLDLLTKNFYVLLADAFEQNGCVGKAFNYLVKVLDPSFDTSQKSETRVPFDITTFLLAIELNVENARGKFLYYCSVYFTVSSVLGFNSEDAKQTYHISKMYSKIEEAEEIDVKYWCSVSELLFRTKSSSIQDILWLLLKQNHSSSTKFKIIETLLRFNHLTSNDQATLFKVARRLKVYGANNISKKALKFWSCIQNSPVSVSNVKESFIELLRYINDFYPDKIQQRLHKTRISWVINEMIYKLLTQELNYKLAFELAFRWQTNETQLRLEFPEDNLFILSMATIDQKKCWYLIKQGQTIRLHKYEYQSNYSDFISKKNKIESSWLSMLEEKDSHTPFIPGNPNIHRDNSEDYETYLREVYCFDKLFEAIQSFKSFSEVHIFELSAANVPLQAFLSKHLNGEIPVSMLSSYKVSRQRELKKALLWMVADFSLNMVEQERDALLYMSKEHGYDETNLTIRYGCDYTKDEFLELYLDASFDLIWISGHGVRDSDNPYNSHLKISATENIYIGDLANLPIPGQEFGRRLLVLNMCETASVYIRYNAMDFLSISSLLTNEYQSVLGHLWPTNYLVSPSFGSLFYLFLLREINWNYSISKSQYILSKGYKNVIDQFNERYPKNNLEILKRIENNHQSIELDIIANWGSSSYSC